MENGNYTIGVSLSGGSGKATVNSPTELNVKDNHMSASIEWSSPNYDYMEVDGKEYYPVNEGGNSVFVIDVSALDTEIPVRAETTAMSEPHMIEYTLYFDSSTLQSDGSGNTFPVWGAVLAGMAVLIIAAAVCLVARKGKNAK